MFALLAVVVTAAALPTPSPTISPLPPAVVQWYAQRGARASGLDPQLVRAVIDAESGGDPKAVSVAGAVGLMQLMPQTAHDCGIDSRYDALANVRCGAMTLSYLVRRYGVEIGVAAYNFGAGNVVAVGAHFSKTPVQTQAYVRDVLEQYDRLQHETLAAAAPASPAAEPPQLAIAWEFPPAPTQYPACDAFDALSVV